MEAAGIDRPDIQSFEDSTVRATRQASASQTPEPAPKSSNVQVVIKSNASLLRTPLHLQNTNPKLREPPDKVFERKSVASSEEDESSATATNDVDPFESAEFAIDSSACANFGKSDLKLKNLRAVHHWSLPSNLRTRQLQLIHKSIRQSNPKKAGKSKARRLEELEKAVKRVKQRRRVAQVSPSKWQQFSGAVPSKAPSISQDLLEQIFPSRLDTILEKETLHSKEFVEAEEGTSGLVLVSQKITARGPVSTKLPSMPRQPEDDNEMSGVETNSAVESKTYPLTDECQHYERRDEVPWDIQKCVRIRSTLYKTNCYLGTGLKDIAYFQCMMKEST